MEYIKLASSPFRAGVRQLAQPLLQTITPWITQSWAPYSRLFLLSDSSLWVISWEMREVAALVRQMGIQTASSRWLRYSRNQAAFYGSHLGLLGGDWPEPRHRLGTTYFHGRPGSGEPVFDRAYANLCRYHPHIQRVQVSHTEMRDLMLEAGLAPEKLFLIPIGINLSFFQSQTADSRRQARVKYNIPQSAVVVGSFQKDGVGWGDGMQPKFIKGPDVFLETIKILKSRIPELFVLLSGPARGYVKAGLTRLGVPYRHYYLQNYPQVAELFQALDMYLVSSRQEGGPKAVLEAMASGTPLVTTRVGQAMDLVQHRKNGYLVDVEDATGLADWAEYILNHSEEVTEVLKAARQTAEANSYQAQLPLWQRFMQGFVEWEA
jgi:glycosyltransferase involved in cell wall biosynthesis